MRADQSRNAKIAVSRHTTTSSKASSASKWALIWSVSWRALPRGPGAIASAFPRACSNAPSLLMTRSGSRASAAETTRARRAPISCADSRSRVASRWALRDNGASMRTVAVLAMPRPYDRHHVSRCVEDDAAPAPQKLIDLADNAVVQTVRLPVHGQAAATHELVELLRRDGDVVLGRVGLARHDAPGEHEALIRCEPLARRTEDGVLARAARPHDEHDEARADARRAPGGRRGQSTRWPTR